MKTLKTAILFFIIANPMQLLAQKNAPVAGNAARLIDLLYRDYSNIDPSTKLEEIGKDRNVVIGIFKTYLEQPMKEGMANADALKMQDNLNFLLSETENLMYFDNMSVKFTTELTTTQFFTERAKKQGVVNKYKKDYHECKYGFDTLALKSIQEAFYDNENTFLSEMSANFTAKYKALALNMNDNFAKFSYDNNIQKSTPFIGGTMAFETVVDELSKFLAQRIKEELANQVILKFQRWLNDKEDSAYIALLKVFLPKTHAFLTNFKVGEMANFGNQIQQYIEADFKSANQNIGQLRYVEPTKSFLAQNPNLDFAIEAMELLPRLSGIENPIDFFDLLESSKNIRRWLASSNNVEKNLANSIRMTSLVAHSLVVSESGEKRFASTEFMSKYGKDIHFIKLYLGFLHQQNKKYYNIEFSFKTASNQPSLLDKQLKALMEKNGLDGKIDVLTETLTQITEHSEVVYKEAQMIRRLNKSGIKIGADTAYNFVHGMINLSKNIALSCSNLFDLGAASRGDSLHIGEEMTTFFDVANQVNETVLNFRKKDYAIGIANLVDMTGRFVYGNGDTTKISSKGAKFIHFVSEVALAENSEELQAAFNAATLPSGSFILKRESAAVTLNSYPGFLYSRERTSLDGINKISQSVAFTAPVGVSFSIPLKIGSIGLFVPLVDLGAFTKMHLASEIETDSSEVVTFPEFTWKSIVSPGLYLSYGFKNTPLSINLGAQYGPGIRAINADGTFDEFESFRYSAGIVLDLPLLRIYSKVK